MTDISDELRKVADEYDVFPLYKLADRIDDEMVEFPKDRDGVPIHVGDTVYLRDGRKYHVFRINIARDHTSIDVNPFGKGTLFLAIEPTRFTHTAPDSFERIADELDNLADANYASGLLKQGIKDFAERIRKLTKEQTNE